MNKYNPKTQAKDAKNLPINKYHQTFKTRQQAIADGLAQARKANGKLPRKLV
ncbi:MAG: hypothetical protein ACXWLH_03005 [Candidatus Saccharimonadales bacterium]